MGNKKKGKVLDIAAGMGNISFKLQEKGFEVHSADIDPKRFKPQNLNCIQVDANKNLPWENDEFDYVVSVETIEHLENPWNFIREIHRILKPEGSLIITTPNVESWLSRLFFLFFGQLKLFGRFYPADDHITPIFTWNLNKMINNKFKISHITYNDLDEIPILPRIRLKIRPGRNNKFWGFIQIIEMEKI